MRQPEKFRNAETGFEQDTIRLATTTSGAGKQEGPASFREAGPIILAITYSRGTLRPTTIGG